MSALLSISLTLVISVLLLSCGPSQQGFLDSTMYSWVGHHRNDLVRAWGPPIQDKPLSTGGTLLVYHSSERQRDAQGNDTLRDMLQRCRMEIETDSSGKIVRWQYQSQC